MRKLFVAAAFLFLAVGLLSAFGQVPYGRANAVGAGGLGLTEEQNRKIEELQLAFQKEILGLESQWRALGLEIEALTRRGKSYEGELKKIQGIETELDKKYEDHWNQIRFVLTPEQQASFDRYGGLGLGMGLGMRYGWGAAGAPRWGMGRGYARGGGYAAPAGFGRGAARFSRFGAGYGRGGGRGYGLGYGAGYGRGYFCPWRWR